MHCWKPNKWMQKRFSKKVDIGWTLSFSACELLGKYYKKINNNNFSVVVIKLNCTM